MEKKQLTNEAMTYLVQLWCRERGLEIVNLSFIPKGGNDELCNAITIASTARSQTA